VICLGYSVSFSTEVKQDYSYTSTLFLENYGLFIKFARQKSETQFVAIHHVEDRFGSIRCADCRYFRQDGTSIVTVSFG
jgi:hypothetical protein